MSHSWQSHPFVRRRQLSASRVLPNQPQEQRSGHFLPSMVYNKRLKKSQPMLLSHRRSYHWIAGGLGLRGWKEGLWGFYSHDALVLCSVPTRWSLCRGQTDCSMTALLPTSRTRTTVTPAVATCLALAEGLVPWDLSFCRSREPYCCHQWSSSSQPAGGRDAAWSGGNPSQRSHHRPGSCQPLQLASEGQVPTRH